MSMGPVPSNLRQPTDTTPVPFATMATTLPVAAQGIDCMAVLYSNITPYKPARWKLALSSAGLTCSFPNLVHDMTFRVPIGNPPLTHTFIPNNLKSADIDPSYMDSFIKEEIDVGRFDRPFSVEQAHYILWRSLPHSSPQFCRKAWLHRLEAHFDIT